MAHDQDRPTPGDGGQARAGAPEGEARPGDRYEPPRLLKKRAVARIASQFSGGGPSASGPLLVGDG